MLQKDKKPKKRRKTTFEGELTGLYSWGFSQRLGIFTAKMVYIHTETYV